ncbi:MAG: YabP/YqfC family sporulation protein [Oscillospiraceae bacterium]|nr:YabP/YqfC family sporulation protein [Oscillospiraceae bacterium]
MQKPEMFRDRMELCGNTDMYFDKCRRLLECSEMLILAECGGHRIAVWGSGLSASDYSAGGLHVHGQIAAIEFDGGL